MKRINPLLTANNPAPIPGCHAARRLLRTVLFYEACLLCTSGINLNEKKWILIKRLNKPCYHTGRHAFRTVLWLFRPDQSNTRIPPVSWKCVMNTGVLEIRPKAKEYNAERDGHCRTCTTSPCPNTNGTGYSHIPCTYRLSQSDCRRCDSTSRALTVCLPVRHLHLRN